MLVEQDINAGTLGIVAASSTDAYDLAGNRTLLVNGNGSKVSESYDALGDVVVEQDINSAGTVLDSVTKGYDGAGNETLTQDGLGRKTLSAYDAAGNMTARTVAYGTTQAAATSYGYDDAGNLILVVDPNLNRTTLAYDGDGNEISMTDALTHTESRAYNLAGELTQLIERNGDTLDYAYDGSGAKIGETWFVQGNNNPVDTLSWSYDDAGHLLTASDINGTYALGYNGDGEVTSVSEPFGVSLTMAYDDAGNRTLVTDSLGGATSSTYNGDAELVDRILTSTSVPTLGVSQQFDLAGNMLTQTRTSNGTTVLSVTDSYTETGQPTSQAYYNGGGTSLDNYSYSYDAADELSVKTAKGTGTTYGYDNAGQLTSAGPTTYQYDLTGNPDGTGYSPGPGNELLDDPNWQYTYDANGNVTKKVSRINSTTWLYGYDNRNEQTSAKEYNADPTVPGTGATLLEDVEFKYDVFGNRIEKDVTPGGGSTTAQRYAYDGWNPAQSGATGNSGFEIWADLDGNSHLQTRYLRGDVVDQLFARVGTDNMPYWYATDYQNSAEDVIDNTGTVKDAVQYDAFGNIVSPLSSYLGRYAWTGREWDAETHQQYNHARYYNPQTGQWMSQDPLGFDAGDSNLYRYVFNRPTNATDPSGNYITTSSSDLAREITEILTSNRYCTHYIRLADADGNKRFALVPIPLRSNEALSDRISNSLFGKALTNTSLYGLNLNLSSKDAWLKAWRTPYDEPIDLRGTGITGVQLTETDLKAINDYRTGVLKPTAALAYSKPILGTPQEQAIYDKYYSTWGYTVTFPSAKITGIGPNPLPGEEGEPRFEKTAERQAFERKYYDLVYQMQLDKIAQYNGALKALENKLDPSKNRYPDVAPGDSPQNSKQYALAKQFGTEELGPRPQLPPLPSSFADFIPVLGSARYMYYKLDNGDYLMAAVYAGLAISDVFLVKGALTGAGRALTKVGRLTTALERGSTSDLLVAARRAAATNGTSRAALREIELVVLQRSCFVAGTPILTPTGAKPIETFQRGDQVLARAETDVEGPVEVKTVEETFVRESRILEVRVRGRTIRTTAEHPFFVKGKGWVCASELRPGHQLSSHDGQWVTVEAVTDLNEVATVYNLRVSDYHTYFVGSREWGFSVWAHNAECAVLVREGESWLLRSAGSDSRVLARGTLEEVTAFAGTNSHNIRPLWTMPNGTRSVAEAESSFGRLALQHRVDHRISPSYNVFVVEYEANGVTRTVPYVSDGILHSEEIALRELPREARVLRAYSERTPCTLETHDCFTLLRNDARFASMQELQWSYPWRINETANRQAIAEAMRQFQPR